MAATTTTARPGAVPGERAGRDSRKLVRRVLTYIPDFAPEWRVQQGNVGMHYLEWRYTLNGLRFGSNDGLPTP